MGINAKSLALVRSSDNLVETFLRLDIPETWEPPEGYYVVPDDELPEGWQKYEAPVVIPETISARQIRIWLIQHNISLSAIEQAINSIPDEVTKEIVKVEWEYAPFIERKHPWINSLGQMLGLDSNAIDRAFIEASII
jgi:hypothetical protein